MGVLPMGFAFYALVRRAGPKRERIFWGGLWGTTIGGGETHDAWAEIPDHVYDEAVSTEVREDRENLVIGFEKGVNFRTRKNRPVANRDDPRRYCRPF